MNGSHGSNWMARRWSVLAFLAATSMFIGGCALTTDRIEIAAPPVGAAAAVKGAEGVTVDVQVTDERPADPAADRAKGESKVGAKRNGFGAEMAPILASNDVAAVIKKAIDAELTARGFKSGGGAAKVTVALQTFVNDFKMGFTQVDAHSDLTMTAVVKRPDGSVLYTRRVTADGTNQSLVATGDTAKVALESALRSAVDQLVNDPGFIAAILKAKPAEGGAPAAAAPAS